MKCPNNQQDIIYILLLESPKSWNSFHYRDLSRYHQDPLKDFMLLCFLLLLTLQLMVLLLPVSDGSRCTCCCWLLPPFSSSQPWDEKLLQLITWTSHCYQKQCLLPLVIWCNNSIFLLSFSFSSTTFLPSALTTAFSLPLAWKPNKLSILTYFFFVSSFIAIPSLTNIVG